MKTLSIIIPVYNEKDTLSEILRVVENVQIPDFSKEIILVDDYSTDGSRTILEEFSNAGKYKVFFQEKNYGKGSAVRLGFAHATGDYIVIQDADLEYNPKEYINLLEPLLKGQVDVVYGSRFSGGRGNQDLFFGHYFGNRFLTMLSNVFTGFHLTDIETCYKMFTKS